MPKTKKEEDKKNPRKKTGVKKTPSKKTSVKKPSSKKNAVKNTSIKKGSLGHAGQAITIDVITDNEDVLYREPIEDELEEYRSHDDLDVQKKYFSDLVLEMKDKQESKNLPINSEIDFKVERHTVSPRKSLRLYRRMAFQSAILTCFLFLVVAYFLVPSLKIFIKADYETIADTLSFRVSSEDTQVDSVIASSTRNLKGDLVVIPISVEKIYQATGEEVLGEEVIGQVTLHNEYNRSQPLVVNTRLLSEDNKLYRLSESVNIPANSTMQADVYADNPSQEMAIGPSRFSIPGLWLGLQDRIYATSESNFTYQHQLKKYVKQSDLDQAKIDIKNSLSEKSEKSLKQIETGLNEIAYLLDNSNMDVKIEAKLGEEIEQFRVTASNNLVVSSFPKDQAETLVKAKLSFILPDDKKLNDFKTSAIVYRLEAYDAAEKSASISASFKATMSLRTDSNIIDKKQLAGLNQDQIAEYLRSFPEIISYRLEFFPAFLKTAPVLPDRIKVEIMDI